MLEAIYTEPIYHNCPHKPVNLISLSEKFYNTAICFSLLYHGLLLFERNSVEPYKGWLKGVDVIMSLAVLLSLVRVRSTDNDRTSACLWIYFGSFLFYRLHCITLPLWRSCLSLAWVVP